MPSSTTPPLTPDTDSEYGPVINGLPTKKELASDANGEYAQTTILPDDPGFIFDPSLIGPDTSERFSLEEIGRAHKAAVEMAVSAIDSPMNGAPHDPSGGEEWWAANQDKYAPKNFDEFHAAALSSDANEPVVYKGTHRSSYGLRYGAEQTHITDRTIETTALNAGEVAGLTCIAVSLTVNFGNAVELDGVERDERAVGNISYTLTMEPGSGEFLITGYSSTFTTQPLH